MSRRVQAQLLQVGQVIRVEGEWYRVEKTAWVPGDMSGTVRVISVIPDPETRQPGSYSPSNIVRFWYETLKVRTG